MMKFRERGRIPEHWLRAEKEVVKEPLPSSQKIKVSDGLYADLRYKYDNKGEIVAMLSLLDEYGNRICGLPNEALGWTVDEVKTFSDKNEECFE